jgi:hypothetical protein
MALYDELLGTAKAYMGPAAERFLARQLSALNMEKGLLGAQHMEALGDRCYTSAKLLMDDDLAREFGNKVKGLR